MEEELRLGSPAVALRRVRYTALKRCAWRCRQLAASLVLPMPATLRNQWRSGSIEESHYQSQSAPSLTVGLLPTRIPRVSIPPRSQISSGQSKALFVASKPEQLARVDAGSRDATLLALRVRRPDARRRDAGSRAERRGVRLADASGRLRRAQLNHA